MNSDRMNERKLSLFGLTQKYKMQKIPSVLVVISGKSPSF